jgi:prepilin signal peptidase PulO-like enzyme (type II secretory pathway)
MDYITSRIFIIYITGVVFIILSFIYLVYFHFRKDENIDLKENWGIILIYLFLLVLSIYTWGVISNFIDTMLTIIEIHKKMTEINIG